jgi:serine protease
MKNPLHRYAVGALAIGAIAGGAALCLPGSEPTWQPVTYGLTATPAQLLPPTVSTAQPVRVVSTALDQEGRPVVTVHTATDKTSAAELVEQGQQARNAVGVELDATMTAADVPAGTDPYRTQQWDLSKIRVGDAWQRATGAGVTVAVIDTGVDSSHPDLTGQVLPGIDIIAGTSGTSTDPNGHGTHVAGTIAALTGNGVGVSAVAPNATILPVRVLGANGSGYMSDAATGIIYAADHGANVINMSLGSDSKVLAVSNAIAYARSMGVVVVAAAGNARANGSPTSYPAADAGVIAVAATDSNDAVASYSNQGDYVDVAAPGSAVLSTYPTALAASGYATLYGTSMASPHVAAVAALLKSYNSALTPDQVEQAMESSAVDLGAAGKDRDYGYGRVDAAAALTAAGLGTTAPTTPVTPTPTVTKTVIPEPTKTVTPTPTKTVIPEPTKTVSPTPAKTVTPTPTKTVPPAPKVFPVVKVVTSSPSVLYGTTSTVTYTVTASGKPWAQRPVRIGIAEAGSTAFAYTDAVTDGTGKVVVSRTANGKFQFRLVVKATDTSFEAASVISIFIVRSQVAVAVPAAGTLQVTLTGAAGQTVQVQRYDRNRWVLGTTYVASGPTKTLTGLTSATRYRVVVPDTAAIIGAISESVLVS